MYDVNTRQNPRSRSPFTKLLFPLASGSRCGFFAPLDLIASGLRAHSTHREEVSPMGVETSRFEALHRLARRYVGPGASAASPRMPVELGIARISDRS